MCKINGDSLYLSHEELLRLDSCWASSRIFSMSPLWIEDDDGTCSSPPTMASSSSTWGRGSKPGAGLLVEDCWADPTAPLFISNSTQDPVGRNGQTDNLNSPQTLRVYYKTINTCYYSKTLTCHTHLAWQSTILQSSALTEFMHKCWTARVRCTINISMWHNFALPFKEILHLNMSSYKSQDDLMNHKHFKAMSIN